MSYKYFAIIIVAYTIICLGILFMYPIVGAFLIIFFIGASLGSFVMVCVDRIPKGLSITEDNTCDYCGHVIPHHFAIPLLSYIFLGGRCKYCHARISSRYPIIEVLSGILLYIAVAKIIH